MLFTRSAEVRPRCHQGRVRAELVDAFAKARDCECMVTTRLYARMKNDYPRGQFTTICEH
jgi:hypothetical protein